MSHSNPPPRVRSVKGANVIHEKMHFLNNKKKLNLKKNLVHIKGAILHARGKECETTKSAWEIPTEKRKEIMYSLRNDDVNQKAVP